MDTQRAILLTRQLEVLSSHLGSILKNGKTRHNGNSNYFDALEIEDTARQLVESLEER